MWGAALVVFREVFEIAIILCVMLAATKGLKDRAKWINLGILGGAVGAVFFALITQSLEVLTEGAGKQYFNAAVLLSAVLMIGWTVIWMKQHSRTIVNEIKQVSSDIAQGIKPLHMLSIAIGLAVLREGSEIVVFVYGLVAANQTTVIGAFLGGLIGLAMGSVFGLFMYYGLLRISIKYLFQVTSVLLTLIAAGMAANAAGKLVSVGLLPALVKSMWDTSAILPQHDLLGRFLFILIGYQDHPNGMQVLFYAATVAIIYFATTRKTKAPAKVLAAEAS